MPYIKQERRDVYDPAIRSAVEALDAADPDAAKGELNYLIFSIVKSYVQRKGFRYHRLQDFICGTLTACQHELMRRLMDPYEDDAIKKNGDV